MTEKDDLVYQDMKMFESQRYCVSKQNKIDINQKINLSDSMTTGYYMKINTFYFQGIFQLWLKDFR